MSSQTRQRSEPGASIETDVPARLDRLPWNRFHWLLVVALGVTWVLDGLEATIVAAINPVLRESSTLGLSAAQVGVALTAYLAGAIIGALVFGHLTDRLGRKRLFSVTLGVYLVGAVLTAFAWDFWSFMLFRCVTGMAIGGEYSAINSAIDELIPASVRGRVDLAVNGTYWLGAIAGAGASVLVLDPNLFPEWLGWRLLFGLGGLIGLVMIFARQYVPESPRWLLTHGRQDEAEKVMRSIEAWVDTSTLPAVSKRLTIKPGSRITFATIARTLFVRYRRRALLGLVLIASQAFFYNGITFSFPQLLVDYLDVRKDRTGLYMVVLFVANLMGPFALGHFFDTIGRRKMIAATYALSGVVIVLTEVLFLQGTLTALSQTLLWSLAFFFASAAASAGYLTVSEIFPLEMRALSIALFYALGTAIGGLLAPTLFGVLLETKRPDILVIGYLVGAGLMLGAAAVEWWIGIDSEGRSLEDVAAPLSAEEDSAKDETGGNSLTDRFFSRSVKKSSPALVNDLDVRVLHRTREEDAMGSEDHLTRLTEKAILPQSLPNQGIVEGAEIRLRSNSYLALKNVSCEYNEGVLTLRGCLPSYYLKQMAQTAVARLDGVQRIVNEIEVISSTRR